MKSNVWNDFQYWHYKREQFVVIEEHNHDFIFVPFIIIKQQQKN